MSKANDTTIERVMKMESILNDCRKLTDSLAEKVADMEEIREPMIRLFEYYGSEEWFDDREAEIPGDVPAGVLSEDLVYDLITDLRDTAFQMLELSTDILKNRI